MPHIIARVILNNSLTDLLETNVELKQGACLAPLVFNLTLEQVACGYNRYAVS